MFTYYELGGSKRLCDIVVAGSHDAGITSGGGNAQTQSLDIFNQAVAGVRVFDLRIAATKDSKASGSTVSLKAIHADPKLMRFKDKKDRSVEGMGVIDKVKTTKLPVGGDFGMGLQGMLRDAVLFVRTWPSEFLILKFDKCTNVGLVAEMVKQELGDYIFKGGGSLNEQTLDDLKGKVVAAFTDASVHDPFLGIFGCKSLSGGGSYSPRFAGLQYVGKGGTSPLDGKSDMGKIAANMDKQGKQMALGATLGAGTPEIMGMMYWTTTGLKRSIAKRDDTMWGPNRQPTLLAKLWTEGFGESLRQRLPGHINMTQHGNGGTLKAFMPNIVMIDFAEGDKCRFIYGLNTTAATMLTQTARQVANAAA